MTQEAQLKACPFCGGEATIWKAFPQANYPWATGVEHTDSCPDAGWEGLCHKTEAEAIAAWNTRIESGVVAELVGAAKQVQIKAENACLYFIDMEDRQPLVQANHRLRNALAKLEASK